MDALAYSHLDNFAPSSHLLDVFKVDLLVVSADQGWQEFEVADKLLMSSCEHVETYEILLVEARNILLCVEVLVSCLQERVEAPGLKEASHVG